MNVFLPRIVVHNVFTKPFGFRMAFNATFSTGNTRHMLLNSLRACSKNGRSFSRSAVAYRLSPIPARPLFTLDPQKMESLHQQVYDLSGHSQATYCISNETGRVPELPKLQLSYSWEGPQEGRRLTPFPEGTKGVLYYHHLDSSPPISGELRFRICDTPAEFEGGQDLLRRDGDLPWSIRLCSFAMVDKYQGAVHLLRQDGMVDEGVLDDLAELPPIPRSIRNVLCEIGQPFEVNLASALIPLVVVDRYGWQMFEMRNMFRDNRDRMRKHPYTGKALIRLVVSPLPEHAEDPALFIQFVKWLTPVECIIPEYDYHVARPVPNTYYRLKDKKGVYKRWSYALKPKWNADNLRRMLDLKI